MAAQKGRKARAKGEEGAVGKESEILGIMSSRLSNLFFQFRAPERIPGRYVIPGRYIDLVHFF